MNAFLIIDIGTGNVRVALTKTDGEIIWIGRKNVIYKREPFDDDALFFEPDFLWRQILELIDDGLNKNVGIQVVAASASSQREGIVLLDKVGRDIIGFPNHDHRGKFLEPVVQNKNRVYELTGRFPASLFSAFKVIAFREQYPERWEQADCFLSISDWAQYKLTGVKAYEHSQASETLLYDVRNKRWSEELLDIFDLKSSIVPPLYFSGTVLGDMRDEYSKRWNLGKVPVIVGGADTQMAVKSTMPEVGDIVIVSGTTTPVVKTTNEYLLDKQQRSWTNSHIQKDEYILETNCGVTGLNYQRFKEIFYPGESYEKVESDIDKIREPVCAAHLGSLLADENKVLPTGGFLFRVPVLTELSRGDFAFSVLWDIACSIKENFDCLVNIQPDEKDYVWCCGGGFQSVNLRNFVSGLISRKILFRHGNSQATVSGAAVVCAETMKTLERFDSSTEVVRPDKKDTYQEWFQWWKNNREMFKRLNG